MTQIMTTDFSASWRSAREVLPTATSWFEAGFDRGDHVGVQMVLQVDDTTLVSAAAGDAAPGTAMREDTVGVLLCASKPMVAAALVRAVEQGRVSLTDQLGAFLPEVRGTGLADVTLGECVTHSITGVDAQQPDDQELYVPLAEAVAVVIGGVTRSRADAQVQYRSWPFVLVAAVLEAVYERPLADLMRDEVFLPLGMADTWMGMPADVVDTYRSAGRLAELHDCFGDVPRTVPMVNAEWALPTSGVRGPCTDIAKFYRALMLAREGTDTGWLAPLSAWAMTTRHRVGVPEADSTAMIDFGLGVELESRHYDKVWMSYGPHNSLATFGHKGQGCYLSFCDPAHRLVLTVFVNGQIEGMAHGRRMFQFARKVYEDLELA
jgi:CubicO group peptidase (beta-lactamase class C family)